MQSDSRLYDIALTFLPGVGDISAKKIFTFFGNSKSLFEAKLHGLQSIPGIGEITAQKIYSAFQIALDLAKEELEYIYANEIEFVTYAESNYPARLKECADAPFVLYYKGNPNFEKEKIISIVGTRSPSNYGISFCEKIISDIAEKYPNAVILSGLAYGIDIAAHKAAINANLETWAVLGNGLATIYPSQHKKIAQTIYGFNGAIMCDYPHFTKPDAQNFPKRNRIVAGLSDAVIVVESGIKGGSIITATIANSYNRDVFALPGDIYSIYSKGCNNLIKTNRANLIDSIEDLEYLMNWTTNESPNSKPKRMLKMENFNENERYILEILQKNGATEIDNISRILNMNSSTLSLTLLELELKGIIKVNPGKMYSVF
ncbi:MAG: DNA-processing protein DprA [Bacteroidales bacterium]|jgi:DNA processing protein|nr:DNA-processing protein DprA [Bacteroidales bacterium]